MEGIYKEPEVLNGRGPYNDIPNQRGIKNFDLKLSHAWQGVSNVAVLCAISGYNKHGFVYFCVIFLRGNLKIVSFSNFTRCRYMLGGRGSSGLSSHTHTFPDLVPPSPGLYCPYSLGIIGQKNQPTLHK